MIIVYSITVLAWFIAMIVGYIEEGYDGLLNNALYGLLWPITLCVGIAIGIAKLIIFVKERKI